MKYLLFIVLLGAVLITAGCISENKNTLNTNSQITTIPTTMPITGVTKHPIWEKYDKCANEKLKKQGWFDCNDSCIDCIMNPKDPVCQNNDRYNAQVNALNECLNQT